MDVMIFRGKTRDETLPSHETPTYAFHRWSADGKSLFATAFALTGSSLFHVTLDGKYSVLYKGAKEVEAARPSPDGRYLAFGDVVSASNVWLVEGFPK
jgi:Tol biopolymer transport system component